MKDIPFAPCHPSSPGSPFPVPPFIAIALASSRTSIAHRLASLTSPRHVVPARSSRFSSRPRSRRRPRSRPVGALATTPHRTPPSTRARRSPRARTSSIVARRGSLEPSSSSSNSSSRTFSNHDRSLKIRALTSSRRLAKTSKDERVRVECVLCVSSTCLRYTGYSVLSMCMRLVVW